MEPTHSTGTQLIVFPEWTLPFDRNKITLKLTLATGDTLRTPQQSLSELTLMLVWEDITLKMTTLLSEPKATKEFYDHNEIL